MHIITLITLEQFEVEKSRSSYDVPFISYDFDFGKKKLRLLNYHFEFGKKQKLRLLKLYYKSGRKYLGHTNSLLLRQTSYGRNFSPSCRPPSFLVVKKVKLLQKVPLNLLKIGQRVAYR